mmetsp:Transcript_41519/g.65844  ORF Transcript_41519/g.65844 Transcript_41519/m.65844 type:complete len:311 (-) Transcript_41519:265-1197(-)
MIFDDIRVAVVPDARLSQIRLPPAVVFHVEDLIAHHIFLSTSSPRRTQLRLHRSSHLSARPVLKICSNRLMTTWTCKICPGSLCNPAWTQCPQLLHLLHYLGMICKVMPSMAQGSRWHPVSFKANEVLRNVQILVDPSLLATRDLEVLAVGNHWRQRLGILAICHIAQPVFRVARDFATVHPPHRALEIGGRHVAIVSRRHWVWRSRPRHPVFGHVKGGALRPTGRRPILQCVAWAEFPHLQGQQRLSRPAACRTCRMICLPTPRCPRAGPEGFVTVEEAHWFLVTLQEARWLLLSDKATLRHTSSHSSR